jgi:hypothetical protein
MTNKGNASSNSNTNISVSGTGIVIGDGSSVVVGQSPQPIQMELSVELGEFMNLLARHEDAVDDPPGIRECLMQAQREVAEPSPRWPIVRTLLRGIAASVSGAAVLTEAINNILVIVGRIPK